MIRIRRLLATLATSAVLLLGAVIALEALGLLFQRSRPDPEPVIANANFREVPEETAPAHLLKQLEEQERAKAEADEVRAREEQAKEERRLEAERQAATDAAEDEARRLAEARKREAETGSQKVAALGPPPVTDAPRQAEPEPAPQEAARTVKLAPSAEPDEGERTVHPAPTRRDRARAVRRGNVHQARSRCPFLAWWESVMGPPVWS